MTSGGGAVSGEIVVNIRTEGGTGGGGVPGAGGTPRPAGGGAPPKDPQMSMLNADQKKQLEQAREEKKALKEYQDFQKLKGKESQNDLLNELQRGRRQATMVAGAVTTGMLARNSKIMATATGSLTTMFGAFIDIFLMPFIPLIIPVLKYIASLIPKWMEWTQKFADLFTKNPLAALKWAAEEFLKNGKELGYHIGEMFGISTEKMDSFYKTIGEWNTKVWTAIQTAWTASIDYIKGVWEESGGSVWKSIKIMAGDAWRVAKNAAEAAWCAFVAWQPGVVSTITGAWSGAANYVKGVWEEGGCTVMGSIGVVGKQAMSAIGSAGKWAWSQFAAWQPGVAANIERVWCSASTYVTNAWKAGGGTVAGFFGVVAGNVGVKIEEGLRWLWDTIFRDKVFAMLDSIQNWIWQKTGIGSAPGGRVTSGSGTNPVTGAKVPLSEIGKGFGNLDIMTNQSPSSARPPGWAEFLLRGDYDTGMALKNLGRRAGKVGVPFTDIGVDFLGHEGGKDRDIYEKFIETKSLPMHAEALFQRGESVEDIQAFIQRRVRESYSERFSVVSVQRKNEKWEVNVNINEHFTPNDKIDGMFIS